MNKLEENRFPHVADLFVFCKKALGAKHNHEVKIIDQDVGAILGFDPADCSHWKKGKKNIKSLQALNTIATHLDVDPLLVTNLVTGKSTLEDTLLEFKGYGNFSLSAKYFEELKRQFFAESTISPTAPSTSFEQVTALNRAEIIKVTQELITQADIKSCPVMLPELLAEQANVQLIESEETAIVNTVLENNVFKIFVRSGPSIPSLRFFIARELGRTRLYPTSLHRNDELVNARLNIFAVWLLMPNDLFLTAIKQADHTKDLVSHLSRMFWVNPSMVNARMKECLLPTV